MGIFDKIKSALGGGKDSGRGLEELARRLGVEIEQLKNVHIAYREFEIPKRSGGKRKILAPAPELKKIQRLILQRLLSRLNAHPCAMAYEKGRSIVANALPHVKQAVVVKFDLVDFFPSTRAERVEDYFNKIGWNREASRLLTKLCTHQGGLPQGAPTSPKLSNLVNYRLDAVLHSIAIFENVTYTRYADDVTISFQKFELPQINRVTGQPAADPLQSTYSDRAKINRVIRRMMWCAGSEYRVHTKKKLQVLKRNRRQTVTGLVVNQRLNLPRETRRLLRAVEHHLKHGKPTTLSPAQLAGWHGMLSFIAKSR